MQISLRYKNTKKYNYHCGSNLFDVFIFNKTEFSQTNCYFFITKHKESPLDVGLFFLLKDFDGLEQSISI